MSAFVVHEMKNLVAQLDLMAGNAVRHRDNPEFQADMLATVQNVIERGRRLLLQLRVGATPVESPQAVALLDMVNATMATRNGMRPPPRVAANPAPARVRVHPERMQRVIGHLLQNAAEATGPEGRIDVRVLADGADAVLEIEDDGQGMTQEFIRERLYKPFESTKPMGMGIGVFESREYIRELGGQLDVRSRPGVGTVFAIRLPALQVPPAGVAGPHEATARAPASA
jgi:putative PEP-CTERM system histidine kinase